DGKFGDRACRAACPGLGNERGHHPVTAADGSLPQDRI
ncbi:MAG: hypothetical protein AVDCRST_MAG83-525, partial [uncultured Arthrobacter sp.]